MGTNQKRITKGMQRAIETRDALIAAVATRVEKIKGTGTDEAPAIVAVEWSRITKIAQTEGFVAQLALLNGGIDLAPLIASIPKLRSETPKEGYTQAKTVEKVMRVIDGLASRTSVSMGDYVTQVIYSALVNGGALSMNGALSSLSRRVSNEGNSEALPSRANYSPGTASAQASQVREVVRMTGLGTTTKGKRGDVLTLDPKRVEVLREVFALSEGDSEGGETGEE